MADMSMSPEQKKDFSMPVPTAPRYPHGLRLRLGPEELAKLGIQDAPALDQEMTFTIKAFVSEVEKDESGDDSKKFSVELQVKDMEEVKKEKSASEALYGA